MAQNQKILCVDDEQDILDLLKFNLEKEGYDVLTANNGKKAIEVAKKEIPDLIILDVMMPEMDGMEACRELREISSLSNTVITFLTARNEDYSQIAGFEAGADDFISKPIRQRVLVSKIKALFYNFISAAVSVVGAIFALIIGGQIEGFTNFIIPFTAGGFIYIATSDLFPELKKDSAKLRQSFLQLFGIIVGIGIMLILK